MLTSITSAIRGGALLARLRDTSRPDSAPSLSTPALPSPSEPPPPLWRRLGRRILRLARPLALPFLHRLQRRMTLAVDESLTAARLQRMESMVDHHTRRLDELERRLAEWRDVHFPELRETLTAGFAAAAEARQRQFTQLLSTPLRPSVLVASDEDLLVRGSDGWLLAPREDARLIAALAESGGCLEPGTRTVLRSLLEPGDRAVDVGAHIGLLTLAMARAVGPSGHILAVEPNPRLASLLRRTLQLNDLADRVDVQMCAAGATEGTATLRIGAVLGEGTVIGSPSGETHAIDVPVQPLDRLVQGRHPVVVKLDVEGAEPDVLAGFQETLRAADRLAVIVEFGPAHVRRLGITIEEWLARVVPPGFEGWMIDECGQAGALAPFSVSALSSVTSVNLLFVKGGVASWPSLRRLTL